MSLDAHYISLMSALIPILKDTDWWGRRDDVAWYVNLCEIAGFCNTDDMRRLCAQRYMVGKRKVTPPGTRRRKDSDRRVRKTLYNPSAGLIEAVHEASKTKIADSVRRGNDGALNSLIGLVRKKCCGVDAAAIRIMLVESIKGKAS